MSIRICASCDRSRPIVDGGMCQACIDDLDDEWDEDTDEDHDGQPDEMQEWHDFDPEC